MLTSVILVCLGVYVEGNLLNYYTADGESFEPIPAVAIDVRIESAAPPRKYPRIVDASSVKRLNNSDEPIASKIACAPVLIARSAD